MTERELGRPEQAPQVRDAQIVKCRGRTLIALRSPAFVENRNETQYRRLKPAFGRVTTEISLENAERLPWQARLTHEGLANWSPGWPLSEGRT